MGVNGLRRWAVRGVRRVRRAPGYYALGFVCLALGTGSAAAVFSVVDATLLRPLPYADPESLMLVSSTFAGAGTEPERYYMSSSNIEALAAGVPGLDLAAARFGSADVQSGAEVERLSSAQVTPGWFDVLGQVAIAGRLLQGTDVEGSRVAVVSDAYWRRGFGGDPSLIGGILRIDGTPYEVVGVVSREDALPTDTDVWTPLHFSEIPESLRRSGVLLTVGRLGPGLRLSDARTRADAVALEQGRVDPEVNRGRGLELRPLHESFVEESRPLLAALSVAVAVVLLISCLNVANLLLVRLRRESAELAVRSVLGASARSILLGLMVDNLVFALVSVGAGLGLARLSQASLFGVAGLVGPGFVAPGLDGRIVAFGLVLALVSAVGFGLVPALVSMRARAPLLTRHSARTGLESRSSRRFQGLVVGVQAALGLLLGLGASATARSFHELSLRDPGFDTASVTTYRIGANPSRHGDLAARTAFYESVQAATASLPGVLSAGATNTLPIGDPGAGWSFSVEHRIPEDEGAVEVARGRLITPRYFGSMGIPILAGRDLEWSDRDGSLPVVIVSETLARRYWPEGDAVGRRIKRRTYDSPFPWMTVVGVVGDVRDDGLGEEIGATLYMPVAQVGSSLSEVMSFVFRAEGDGARLVPALRDRLRAIDPEAPVFRVTTVDALVSESMSSERFASRLMIAFAVIGVSLLAAGLYSLIAWIVTERTREVGVRLAVGAQRGRVLGMFVRQGVGLVIAGLAAGAALGLILIPLLARFASGGVEPSLSAWFAIAGALVFVALIASLIPAWRAARLDPAISLRAEC